MRVTSSRVVYENRWMRVIEDRTELADGTPGLYGWVSKPASALIVALDAEDAVGVDAEALARGELAEETGLRASRMEHLGRLHFAYGCPTTRSTCGARQDSNRVRGRWRETEAGLVARRFPRAAVERMIGSNEIRDAASVAAWHLATR